MDKYAPVVLVKCHQPVFVLRVKTGLIQAQSYVKSARELLYNYRNRLYDLHFSLCNSCLYFDAAVKIELFLKRMYHWLLLHLLSTGEVISMNKSYSSEYFCMINRKLAWFYH
jgi:hypothetical protein